MIDPVPEIENTHFLQVYQILVILASARVKVFKPPHVFEMQAQNFTILQLLKQRKKLPDKFFNIFFFTCHALMRKT